MMKGIKIQEIEQQIHILKGIKQKKQISHMMTISMIMERKILIGICI